MNPLNTRARETVDRLISAFDDPSLFVDTITKATLIPNNSPCRKWSPSNRFLTALAGTGDARGYRQWQEVGRHVIKGRKAFFILVPSIRKVKNEDSDEERQALVGFLAAPVFRVEDTDGESLPETTPTQIPKLQIVADALRIPVTYTGAVSENIFGVYRHDLQDRNGNSGQIVLYTHDMGTFYHELAHALHHRTGLIRNGKSDADKRANETVAEISAAVLVRLFEGEEAGRQAVEYVKSYGAKQNHLLTLLPEIMSVVDLAINIAGDDREKGMEDEAANS